MGAGRYYFGNTIVIKGLYIGQGLHLEKELIARALGRVACTTFFGTQYRKRYTRLMEYLGHGLGYAACTLIKAAGTTYPEKDIGLDTLGTKFGHSRNMKVHRFIFSEGQKYE